MSTACLPKDISSVWGKKTTTTSSVSLYHHSEWQYVCMPCSKCIYMLAVPSFGTRMPSLHLNHVTKFFRNQVNNVGTLGREFPLLLQCRQSQKWQKKNFLRPRRKAELFTTLATESTPDIFESSYSSFSDWFTNLHQAPTMWQYLFS